MTNCEICETPHSGRGKTCSQECRLALQLRSLPEKICQFPGCQIIFKAKSPKAKYCSPRHRENCSSCDKDIIALSGKREPFYCLDCSKAEAVKKRSQWRESATADELESLREKVEATNMERYGVRRPLQNESIKAKTRETNREKYGTDSVLQNKSIREKIDNTNRDRYGFSTPAKSEEIKEKTRESNRRKYGVDHPMQTSATQGTLRETMLDLYGVENAAQSMEIRRRAFEKFGGPSPLLDPIVREKAALTNLEKYGHRNPAKADSTKAKAKATFQENLKNGKNSQARRVSQLNRSFAELLQQTFGAEPKLEEPYGPYAADIEVQKTLIELNPTISHNALIPFSCTINGCKPDCDKHGLPPSKDYHQKKALAAQAEGRTLIQIYDWDNLEATMRMLSGKLEPQWKKISARKLAVKPIPQKIANEFLSREHIQGATKKQMFCYGLYQGEELLAVATFGTARFGNTAELEWLRYATRRGIVIHGGAGKLWKMLLAEVSPSTVVSYIDFNHTTQPNTFLQSLDFTEGRPTGPQLIWSKGRKRIYHNSLLAQGADRLLGTSYGRPEECGLNNEQIMLLEGWLPVYTAGNRIFNWEKSSHDSTAESILDTTRARRSASLRQL